MLMKIILLILFLLIPLSVYGENGKVYYCSDTERVGFQQSQNNKFGRFELQRFKVQINFDKNFIKSEDMFFNTYDRFNCYKNIERQSLICSNEWGRSFEINQNTLDFKYSVIPSNNKDSLILSFGKCEIF